MTGSDVIVYILCCVYYSDVQKKVYDELTAAEDVSLINLKYGIVKYKGV